MQNKFYNDFDYKSTGNSQPADYRTPFQKDRDRIIYTSAFRRLQAKTQVFLSGEYDFYRTRLTHSIEVAQIGRSICNYLRRQKPLSERSYIDPDLVEAVCLAHDIGHPPFGHTGENTLNRLMKDYGGFESNAQTLRIVTEIISSDGKQRRGMQPTRAFLDGILKYKTLYNQSENQTNQFIYDEQMKYLEFVFNNQPLSQYLTPGEERNNFRSIECQIMDWADDTAYSLNDIVDGVNAGFITLKKVEKWGADKNLDGEDAKYLQEILNAIRAKNETSIFGDKIGNFIQACRLEERKNFMSDVTNRYCYNLAIDPHIRREANLNKDLANDLVFNSSQLQQLRYKEDHILRKIFETFKSHYLENETSDLNLLPEDNEYIIQNAKDKNSRARLICDYIAGMTDAYAIRIYKRLFDPEFGSIMDLI